MEIKDLKTAIDDYSDAANAGIDALENRLDMLETRLSRPDASLDSKNSGLEVEHKHAFFNDYLLKGDDAALKQLEAKALSTASGDGSFAVPGIVDSEIETQIRRNSPLRALCKVKTIESGDYTRLVNTTGTGAGWVGESDARPETSGQTLEEIKIVPREIYANAAATQRALDDMAFDVEAWLTEDVADEFATQEGNAFINGDGALQPKGFLTYGTSLSKDGSRPFGEIEHIATGNVSGLPADSAASDLLIDLVHALNPRYRTGAVFLMNSATLADIRKLKDADGNFLFRTGMMAGEKGSLLGYPVIEAEHMPDIAASTLPIAFGNFERAYTIVERTGTRVLRDPYSNKPNVQFYATKRVGGALVNDEALKLLKVEA